MQIFSLIAQTVVNFFQGIHQSWIPSKEWSLFVLSIYRILLNRGALVSYSSGEFTIDGFSFIKAAGNEGIDIFIGNGSTGITLKNTGFKRNGENDQVITLLRLRAKINIGGFEGARGTIGFYGNGFSSDVSSGMGPLESATYNGFVTGTRGNMTYVDRDFDCFHQPNPTSTTGTSCSSTPLIRDVLITNLARSIESTSQSSIMTTINSQMMATSSSGIPESSTVLATADISDIKTEIVSQIVSTELARIMETMSLSEVAATPVSTVSDDSFTTVGTSTTSPKSSMTSTVAPASSSDHPVSPASTAGAVSEMYIDSRSILPSASRSDTRLDLTSTPSLSPSFTERDTPSSTMPPNGNNIYKYVLIGGGAFVVVVVIIITVIGARILYVKHHSRTWTPPKIS